MADVDHNSPSAVATLLLVMGGALTLAAGLAGIVTDRLRRLGIAPITTFGVACMLFIIVQMVSLARLPVPSWLIWGTIAAFGSMTVLSYSIMGELFPTEKIGRANGALNILHLGMAFALQSGMGLVAALWQPDAAGHLPLSAYRAAFALPLLLELLAFGWFAAAPLRTRRNTRQVAFAGIDAASLPQAAECPPD